MVLAVYYHAATFEGLADEFNDTHSKGQDFIWAILHTTNDNTSKQMIDYESVDDERLKINQQRIADIFFTFTFLELNERCFLHSHWSSALKCQIQVLNFKFRWGYQVVLDGSKKDIDAAILAHMSLYRQIRFKNISFVTPQNKCALEFKKTMIQGKQDFGPPHPSSNYV